MKKIRQSRSLFHYWPTFLFLGLVAGLTIWLFFGQPKPPPSTDFEEGYLSYIKKDYGASIQSFDRILERDPMDAQAYYQRGKARAGRKAYDLALADYNEAIRLDHRGHEYYFERIILNLFHLRNLDQPLEDAKALQTIVTKNAWTYRVLSLVCLHRKELEEALKAANEAVELGTSPGKKAGEAEAVSFLMRAKVYSALNLFNDGIRDCSTALKLDPHLADAVRLRGYLLVANREVGRGLIDLDKAIEMSPLNSEIYSTRAGVYFLLNRLEESLDDWNQAIQLEPEIGSYRYGRAMVYLRQRNYSLAIADLDESIRLEPEQPGGYDGLAYLWATAPDDSQRNGARAVLYAKKAIERCLRPSGPIMTTLAAAHAEAGEFEKAVEVQKAAIARPTEFLPVELDQAFRCLESYLAKKPYRDAPLPSR